MLEVYRNPPGAVPKYAEQHPLQLHIAFTSARPDDDKARLLSAGCTVFEDQRLDDGSRLIMLRDPWGFPLQLCQRSAPLLSP